MMMTKEEADRFLAKHPKPWRADWSSAPFVESGSSNSPMHIDMDKLLAYIAYLEQENKRLKDSIGPDVRLTSLFYNRAEGG